MMKPTRYIAKCKACNAHTSTLASDNIQKVTYKLTGGKHGVDGVETGELTVNYVGRLVLKCRKCCKELRVEKVIGRISAKHECNAKCLSSHSGVCECSCGGKNHGAAYGVAS